MDIKRQFSPLEIKLLDATDVAAFDWILKLAQEKLAGLPDTPNNVRAAEICVRGRIYIDNNY